MSTLEPLPHDKTSRRPWVAGAALAAVVALVVTFMIRESSAPQPEVTGSPSISSTPGEDASVSTPSPTADETIPTVPAVPGSPPTSPVSAPPPEQPTENEDSGPRETRDPVAITAEATPAQGIEVQLLRIESVEGEAAIPGEVGGPALRITVEVTNNTSKNFPTPAVVVNLYKSEALSPAGPLLKPGGEPFPDGVASGDSATGVYLFTVGPDERDDVTIEVDLAVGTPIVLFQGAVT